MTSFFRKIINQQSGFLFVVGFFVAVAMPVHAEYANHVGLIDNTEIIEDIDDLKIVLNTKTLTGHLMAPICRNTCEMTKLTITPDTIASNNGVTVALKLAKDRLGRNAGIEYDTDKKTVKVISW